MKEQLYHIKTKDNVSIALWKLSPKKHSEKHLLLTHGTFSNRKICDGIASYMVNKGITCWIMEWRNHGNSSKSKLPYHFETIAEYDLKATFQFLYKNQNIKTLDCITHSGGGIVLTMYLINNPSAAQKINSITLFAVQAFGAGTTTINRLKIKSSKYVSAVLGKVPAKTAGSSEHSETYYTMKQWFNWNLSQQFIGNTGFNYQDKMHTIKIPILSICAKGDYFIAPKQGCERFLNAFKNDANKLIYCSKANGYLEDYNHSRILKSQNAKKELWPIVDHWVAHSNMLQNS